jgi:predicted HTH transcriptional regulator
MAKLSHIRSLIARGEHQMLDFKFGITDSRKIARSMVAFSNTDGGTLLIGVKDNGAIAGVRSEEEFYMIEAASNMYCRPEITFEAKSYTEDGKTVLEIVIPKNEESLHYACDEHGKWLVYVRAHDQNIQVNNVWIRVWKRNKLPRGTFIEYTDTEQTLLSYLRSNASITLSAFCKMARIARKKAENVLVNLISLDVVTIEFSERGTFYKLHPAQLKEIQNPQIKDLHEG